MTTTPEFNPPERDPPAIYAASLSDYNEGRLHGEWIDAAQEPDEIDADIRTMLRRSRNPGAEEWAIHDHAGLEPWRPHEYETIQAISRVALGIVEKGPALAHWVASQGQADEETVERFDDVYLGRWHSTSDYAEHLVADIGDEADTFTPSWLQPYVRIDYDALARDLACDLYASEDGRGVHLFRAD